MEYFFECILVMNNIRWCIVYFLFCIKIVIIIKCRDGVFKIFFMVSVDLDFFGILVSEWYSLLVGLCYIMDC